MLVKFVKNALGYKADAEVEIEDAVAQELIKSGKAVAVVAKSEAEEAADALVKHVDERVAASEKRIAKAFSNRAPSITVFADNLNDDPMKGFKSMGDLGLAVKTSAVTGVEDHRLKATGMSAGVDANGGYAVPDVFVANILKDVVSDESLFGMTDILPFSAPGNTFIMPVDEVTTIGSEGLALQWIGRQTSGLTLNDGTAITPTKPTLGERTIYVHKAAILTADTSELQDDAIALSSYLQEKAKSVFNYGLNRVVLRGTGDQQPFGIIDHGVTVKVARATAGVTFDDLRAMWGRRYGSGHVWIINQEVESELLNIEADSGFNLFMPAGGLGGKPFATIFGAPVIVSEHASALGGPRDVLLCDLKGYKTITKGSMNFAVSPHLYFNKDENAYKWTFRVGGCPKRNAVITPANGTETRSHFVQLDDVIES